MWKIKTIDLREEFSHELDGNNSFIITSFTALIYGYHFMHSDSCSGRQSHRSAGRRWQMRKHAKKKQRGESCNSRKVRRVCALNFLYFIQNNLLSQAQNKIDKPTTAAYL